VFVESLRNHRLSEKDSDEELFFNFVVIFGALPQLGALLLL
jgi:hypothetical protein